MAQTEYNYSAFLTKLITINGQSVIAPDPGALLQLRPVGGGSDITLQDPGGIGIYKGEIPSGLYKIVKDGEVQDVYGYVYIFDGTLDATAIVSGLLNPDRIPNLSIDKIIDLSTVLSQKVSKAGDTMQGNLNMNNHAISNLQFPTNINDAASKGYVDGAAVKKVGDEMLGELSLGGFKATNSAGPTAAGDLTNKGYVDDADNERLKLSSAANDILQGTGVLDILRQVTFGKNNFPLPESWGTPTADKHLIHKKFLETYVQSYINGQITAYQQSIRIIRILPTGTVEPNRVYRNLQDGVIAAAANASETNQIVCVVEDDTDEGIAPTDLHDWVHIAGGCETNKLALAKGQYIVGASNNDRGKIIFSNINFIPKSNAVMFRRAIFINCSFAGSFQSIAFENCEFMYCGFKLIGSGNFSLTDCIGTPFITDLYPSSLTGNNPPFLYNNQIHNIKINGSLLYSDIAGNPLFDESGALCVVEVDGNDVPTNTIAKDVNSGKLFYKDRDGNIRNFMLE